MNGINSGNEFSGSSWTDIKLVIKRVNSSEHWGARREVTKTCKNAESCFVSSFDKTNELRVSEIAIKNCEVAFFVISMLRNFGVILDKISLKKIFFNKEIVLNRR